jgi:surface protein
MTSLAIKFKTISANTTMKIPINGVGLTGIIDWGDDNVDFSFIHIYANPGVYNVSVSLSSGTDITLGNSALDSWGNNSCVLEVSDFENMDLISLDYAFYNCSNLTLVPASLPYTITSLSNTFRGATKFNQNIGNWNTSNVVTMNSMFYNANAFNQNIGNWNTTKVRDMGFMFCSPNGIINFNQDISTKTVNGTVRWNTSNVTNMTTMFQNASFFNQNIGNWDTSSVENMSNMFNGATKFNQNIGTWNTANVTNMLAMFFNAIQFNENIGNWDTSSVQDMGFMFASLNNITKFNKNIGSWNTSNVRDMKSMFQNAVFFNQNIGTWNTSNVTNMNTMFSGANLFNQNIGTWNTSNVRDMKSMFQYATKFNQNISTWNTSNVLDMKSMFQYATKFNQNIGSWNTSKVVDMGSMFQYATSFNQNIGSWNVSNVTNMIDFLTGNTIMSVDNFNALLNGWSILTLQPNVTLDASLLFYDKNGEAAYNILTNAPYNWNIRAILVFEKKFEPTKTNINNGILKHANAMPMKDATSEGGSRFSMYRIMHTNNVSKNAHPFKKWIGGNRDSSQVIKNKNISAIGNGSMNTSNIPIGFVSNSSKNVVNDALRRMRSSGNVVPPKNRI